MIKLVAKLALFSITESCSLCKVVLYVFQTAVHFAIAFFQRQLVSK